jgi:CheY-like chemotaxis protein
LNQIGESAQLGSETVRQLQDFARVRTEDPTVAGKIFDFSAVVARAIEVTRPFWKSRPEKRGVIIKMKHRLCPGCYVKGHENELFEAVVNLIKNAAEALPRGGKIYTRTFIKDNHAFLQVYDNGIGISKENLNKVFEPFWTTKGVQGTGMGLSTSFGIVNRHGGLISVRSKEGAGTIFVIKLPVSSKPVAENSVGTGSVANVRARILVIDDQHRLVDLMEKALKGYGQTVLKGFSGKEGLKIFQKNPVDVVVCDLAMPVVNGWQVGKAIKSICEKKGITKTPFILLTGWGGQLEEREKIARCGVDRVLEKPIKYGLLFDAIQDLVQQNGNSER